MVVCAGSLTITFDPTSGQRSYSNLENFHEIFRAPNCRGRADTLKLQSKLSNSAAELTCLRDYMASKVDCKCVGNEVGVAAWN